MRIYRARGTCYVRTSVVHSYAMKNSEKARATAAEATCHWLFEALLPAVPAVPVGVADGETGVALLGRGVGTTGGGVLAGGAEGTL